MDNGNLTGFSQSLRNTICQTAEGVNKTEEQIFWDVMTKTDMNRREYNYKDSLQAKRNTLDGQGKKI